MLIRLVRLLFALGYILYAVPSPAANVPVRYKEGLTHGFLTLSTLDGQRLAVGDLIEQVHGDVVRMRLTYHFKDGSLQDETTVFTQRRRFRLISDHLVQKGPTFPAQTDLLIDMSSGKVTVHAVDNKGKETDDEERMKLPPDLANGLVLTLLKNIPPGTQPPEFPMLVAMPKPRIVKLSIGSADKDSYSLGGATREAVHYVLKVEIGGIEGVIAPLLGKRPPDNHVWITAGEGPTFLKSETLSYMGGPLWRTDLLAPDWPRSPSAESDRSKK